MKKFFLFLSLAFVTFLSHSYAQLIPNGSFELDNVGSTTIQNWTFQAINASTASTVISVDAKSGEKSLKIEINDIATGAPASSVALRTTAFSVASNKEYKLNFWAKAANANDSIAILFLASNNNEYEHKGVIKLGTSWKKYSASYYSLGTMNLKLEFEFLSEGNILLDSVLLTQNASSYSRDTAAINYTSGKLVLDGNANESFWASAFRYDIVRPYDGEAIGFNNPADLTSYWKAAYTDSGMFVLINTTADDVHSSDNTYGQAYEQDRVELYFDMNSDELQDGYGAAHGSSSGHYQFAFDADPGSYIFDNFPNSKYTVKLNGDNSYSQEVFVAWADLKDKKFMPYSLDSSLPFGFDICVSDNDGISNGNPRYRKNWVNNGLGSTNYEDWSSMDDAGILVLNTDNIPITVPVTSISVSGVNAVNEIKDYLGSLQFLANVLPSEASRKSIIWSVNDPSVATINSKGLLKALKNGPVTVRATARDGSAIYGEKEVIVNMNIPLAHYSFRGTLNDNTGKNSEVSAYDCSTLSDFGFSNCGSLYLPKIKNSSMANFMVSFQLNNSISNGGGLFISTSDNEIGVNIVGNNFGITYNDQYVVGAIPKKTNAWDTLKLCFDGKIIKLFVNGKFSCSMITGVIGNSEFILSSNSKFWNTQYGYLRDVIVYSEPQSMGATVAYTLNGNANDESGNNFHGIANGANLVEDRFLRADRAYSFNGLNNNITTSFTGILGSDARTICMWVKTNDSVNWQNVLAYGDATKGSAFRCNINYNGKQGINIDADTASILYAAKVADSSWHHVAWVLPKMANPKLQDVKVYFDGSLLTDVLESNEASTLIDTKAGSNLIIGGIDFSDSTSYFKGSLDDVIVFNSEISAREIASIASNRPKNIPFLEDFEGTFPPKSITFNGSNASRGWTDTYLSKDGGISKVMAREGWGGLTEIILPAINLSDADSIGFELKYYQNHWEPGTFLNTIKLFVSTDQGKNYSNAVLDYSCDTKKSWLRTAVDLKDYKGKVVTLKISIENTSQYIYIDDIKISKYKVEVPEIRSVLASNIGISTVTLAANVFSNYNKATVKFEYGESQLALSQVTVPYDIDMQGDAVYDLSNLKPNTLYNYRVACSNDLGTSYSNFYSFHTSAPTNTADSLSLVTLFNSTKGYNWYSAKNWFTSDVSTWEGIVTEDGRVTEINLKYNNLDGSIPKEIGNLSKLQSLDLSNNRINGSIPLEIGNLSELTILDLNNNYYLAGAIPSEIGSLINLTYLNLQNNDLSGVIPKEIGNLSNLRALLLNDNLLTGEIPSELSKLTNVIDLELVNNQLSGAIPAELGSLHNLENLYLGINRLSGSIPAELGNLSSLRYLELFSNQFSGDIPVELFQLPNIINIRLENNLLENVPDLSSISRKLDFLGLSNNRLTFEDLENNIGVALNTGYIPQALVGDEVSVVLNDGDSYTIKANIGGVNNIYSWYKDGILLDETSNSHIITNFDASQKGSYKCIVSNSVVPGTIETNIVNINMLSITCPKALIAKLSSPMIIDGLLDEKWTAYEKHPVAKMFIGEESGFNNPNDLMAYWQAAWCDSGIFVLTHITKDDIHNADNTYGALWQQDMVEIYFDMNSVNLTDGLGAGSGSGHYQYFYSSQTSIVNAVNFNALTVNKDNSYFNEAFIPWKNLLDKNGKAFEPSVGKYFGFDVNVSDNDGLYYGNPRYRKLWSNNGQNYENWVSMDDAGILQLTDVDSSIIINKPGSLTYGDASFKVATINTHLPLVLSSSDSSVLKIDGSNAIVKGAGNVIITAKKPSNDSAFISKEFNVNRASLKIVVKDTSKVYGNTNPLFAVNYTGFVNGDDTSKIVKPSVVCSATTSSPAGTYDISLTGGSSNNYVFSFTNGKLSIGKVKLVLTAKDTSKTYGAANPDFSIISSGFVNGDKLSVITQPQFKCNADKLSAVGDYEIKLEGGASDRYVLELNSGILTVNKAALTAKAVDTAKIEKAANPVFRIKYSGFVNNESISAIDVLPLASCTATETSPAGAYDIVVNGGSDNNYYFIYENGSLTVDPSNSIAVGENSTISVYPNPTHDILKIKNLRATNVRVQIYNSQGQMVLVSKLDENQSVDVRSLKAGLYTIKLFDNNNYSVSNFMKK